MRYWIRRWGIWNWINTLNGINGHKRTTQGFYLIPFRISCRCFSREFLFSRENIKNLNNVNNIKICIFREKINVFLQYFFLNDDISIMYDVLGVAIIVKKLIESVFYVSH